MTVTGYVNITGNPTPSSSWWREAPISGDRFNTDTPGQLMIRSVEVSDIGIYNNTLQNSIDSISRSVEVIVIGKWIWIVYMLSR